MNPSDPAQTDSANASWNSKNDDLNASESDSNSQTVYEKLDEALRIELEDWHGTPHVWGGNSKRGVDCSGLIQRVYSDLLEYQTSRTTGELIKEGKRVKKSNLRAGDLVFFSPEAKKGGHAGIYLSGGDFAHASSSRGVMTSTLSNPYWTRHYETSRRLILDEAWLTDMLRKFEERQALAQVLQSSSK